MWDSFLADPDSGGTSPVDPGLLGIALEALDEAVVLADADGRIRRGNAAFGRLLADREPPASIDALFAGKRRPPTAAELAVAAEGSWAGEARLPGPGRGTRPVRVRISRSLDPAGAVTGFALVLVDLARQQEDDARLRMFEMAVEQCLEPVLITEAEPIELPGPRIVYANRAFTEVTGYTLDEVRGQTPRILQGSGTDRAPLDQIRRALTAWQPVKVELRNYRKDGTEFWVELAICPVANAKGWYTHWVSVQRDITAKKRYEQQLQEAKEAAERASVAKSLFLANMSHEIRTPLAAILGYSEILLNPLTTPPEREANAQAIRRNGRHLLQIVGSVLDLSKIEAGKVEPEWLADSPWQVALEVDATQRTLAAEKGVTLTTRALGPLPAVCRIDPTLVRQVLLNLVTNAVKFTPPGGGVNLSVAAASPPAAAGGTGDIELQFVVEDDGIGIAAGELDRLFEAFEQGDNSTTRKYGGTGLGLNIARELVGLMGGTIAVASRPGTGSRFTVTLPCAPAGPEVPWIRPPEPGADAPGADDPAPAAATGPAADPGRPAAPPVRGRGRVGGANPPHPRLRADHLRPTGLEVVMAENGRQAVERGLADLFDAILLDMQMPEVDGYSAARQLRQAGFDRPIIALTAHAMPEDRLRCLQAGCTDYLAKPVPVAELYAMLTRHLSRAIAH